MSEENRKIAGQQLKAAREEKGLSLRDIATTTKININVLEAIEIGDVDSLPAKPFARGFLRSYAQYLKLDPTPFVEAFELEDQFLTNDGRTEPEEIPEAIENKKPTVSASSSHTLSSKVIYIAVAVVLILLIVGVKKVVDRYANERIEVTKTQEDTADVEPIIEATSEGNNQSDNPAALPDPSSEQTNNENANTNETNSDSGPSEINNAVTEAAPVVAKEEPIKEESKPAEPTPAPTQKPKKKAAAKQEIIIEALDSVTIEVEIDSSNDEKFKMQPGDVRTIKANEEISLEVSDGGLVNIIHNGKDLGNPGELGKSKKVKFP